MRSINTTIDNRNDYIWISLLNIPGFGKINVGIGSAALLARVVIVPLIEVLRIGRVILAGDFAEAECLSQEAIELGQSSGQKDAGLYFNLQRFAICFERGRLDEIAQSYSAQESTFRCSSGDFTQPPQGVRVFRGNPGRASAAASGG